MATQVQLRRGTEAENDAFTGAQGEVTVDVTNDTLRVHDGSTAGGFAVIGEKGGSVTGDINFGDNDKAIFGAGSDLQIYHSGTTSIINENGTGNLALNTNGANIQFTKGFAENLATFNADGSCTFYYDNATKLATTSTGIDVTGTATMDGLTSTGDVLINGGTNTLDLFNGSGQYALNRTSTTVRLSSGNNVVIASGYPTRNRSAYFANNGDISFYEDTGTTAKFFWDASAESLGIGTTTPSGTLNVKPVDSGTNQIKLSPNGNATTDHSYTTEGGYLAHYQRQDGGTYRRHLDIAAVGDSSWGGVMKFSTNSDGSSTAVERMRIDSSGNVGIGTSSPVAPLDIYTPAGTEAKLVVRNGTSTSPVASIELRRGGSSATFGVDSYGDYRIKNEGGHLSYEYGESGITTERMRIDSSGNLLVGKTSSNTGVVGIEARTGGQFTATKSSGAPIVARRKTSDGDVIQIQKDGTQVGSIGTINGSLYVSSPYGSDSGLRFSGAVVHPCTTSGDPRDNAIDLGYSGGRFKDLYLSGGVYLGGTGSANHLDDYEEGTWTPSITQGITSPTYTTNTGKYTKVGNVVYFAIRVLVSSGTANSSQIQMSLPFTSASFPRGSASFGICTNVIESTTTNIPVMLCNGSVLEFSSTNDIDFRGTDISTLSGATFELSGHFYV